MIQEAAERKLAKSVSAPASQNAVCAARRAGRFAAFAFMLATLSSSLSAEPQSNTEARVDQAWSVYG